ncbi:oligosaccharide flippase family protein [Marinobacter salinisoli]|uniref:Oligosaccharide flippase family protein n=1 Tax=Marinobacter salinisoli TaxID=2769486 RepID=A0ABX7MRF7_9GAMM|nr:oligosaccharide flippase family protein [Marinobacter salinisoli]QSP93974.1 oligosaccharide flippase family protein [Marinobacter salinisoli]
MSISSAPLRLWRSFTANRFLRNIGWLTLSMLASRVLRLAVTVVVARTFTQLDYGQIALIFTTHEIISLFIQRCTQVKLIQAPPKELPSLCRTTFGMNWLLGFTLALVQCAVGYVVATIYGAAELWLPISLLGLCHLILPMAMVPAALNVREGKMHLVAKIEVGQTTFETVSVLVLIASGAGIWALVIPKLLAPFIWVYFHRAHNTWRFDRSKPQASRIDILKYSLNLMVIDGLSVIRQNLDYLLVGYVLGIEALGLYYFAFNAGLGIATTFANAINSAFLPHLCNADHDQSPSERAQKYRSGVKLIIMTVGGVVVLQAATAPLYVPLVFGSSWEEAGSIPLIVILCLTAFPKTLFEANSQYLRALDLPQVDLKNHFWLTVALTVAVVVSVYHSLFLLALATLITYTLAALVLLVFCYRLAPVSPEPAALPQQQVS